MKEKKNGKVRKKSALSKQKSSKRLALNHRVPLNLAVFYGQQWETE